MPSAGSIQKTGVNSWKLTVSAGFDGSGKRVRHTKTIRCSSESEAKKQLALFVAEIEKGQVATSGKMTLNEFFDYWLKNYAEGRHAPKTISYNKWLFQRISQALGHKRVDKIEPKNLLAFYENLREPIKIVRKKNADKNETIAPGYLSATSIRKYHVLLHTIFKKAEQWQFIAYNPVEKVEPPKIERHQIEIYDEETTGRFLILLEQEDLRHRVMALLSISTGMRRGELFGLQWKHIDMDNCTINIEQASQYLPDRGIFTKEPKNEGSKRIVTISASMIPLLKKYKAHQTANRLRLGTKWQGDKKEPENDFMLTTWNGLPAHPDSINTWLKNFIAKHELPHLTPHGFRHMAATYLITAGTDIRTVAGKLGHTNSTTTQIVYSHLLKSAEQETANKLDTFLQQATEKAKQKKQAN